MSSIPARLAALVLVAVLAGAGIYVARHHSGAGTLAPLPAVVLDSASAPKWVELLRSAGVAARAGTIDDALQRGTLVVPRDVQLSADDRDRIGKAIQGGARAVVAEPAVLEATGVGLGPPTEIAGVAARGVAQAVTWPASSAVRPLALTAESSAALASSGKNVVLARETIGKGDVLAVAVDPFADTLQGFELLPALPDEAARLLGRTGPSRGGAEFYFDPGTLKLTPEQAAREFAGARAVYIAGWNYGYITYPYQELIDALHARGVRAYAWLEPPMVNLTLWNKHPECRERTDTGQDAVVDWRSLIALENARCFDLAWSIWRSMLKAFPWDGANVAELYFEGSNGVTNRMTPFHPSALKAFGGNPKTDPAGFLDWRTKEVTRLNRELVSRIHSLDSSLDIELTVIDDELDPVAARNVGSDVKALAAVARAFGASLQVEDPFTAWTLGPNRYTKLTPKVAPLLPPGGAFFDLNVVNRFGDARPTKRMTGAELSLSVMNAARASGRVAVYLNAAVASSELALLPYAVAGAAATNDGALTTPWSVVVSSPREGWNRLLVDGHAWPAANGAAVLPGGTHRLAWQRGEDGFPALERIAAELTSESADRTSLRAGYTTAGTAWAVVDRRPTALTVDGQQATLTVLRNPGSGFTVRLPAGDHKVELSFD
ncbi:MAG: hypothetical protein QOE91_1980 [Gaiellaceae bacterium]|nr:hypothetical protein [Gaiellaceae bacterium]